MDALGIEKHKDSLSALDPLSGWEHGAVPPMRQEGSCRLMTLADVFPQAADARALWPQGVCRVKARQSPLASAGRRGTPRA
ncbi:putative protein OS=Streptomyces antimycoticus OX=68175 GN=SANT12839_023360 PE=4 SV=1 [Streptomyces antimycoticus]